MSEPLVPSKVSWWLDRAERWLPAIERDVHDGLVDRAVGDVYYVCFFIATALELQQGREYKRHSALAAAINRDYVQRGLISASAGSLYNLVLHARAISDYQVADAPDPAEVLAWLEGAKAFLSEARTLVRQRASKD